MQLLIFPEAVIWLLKHNTVLTESYDLKQYKLEGKMKIKPKMMCPIIAAVLMSSCVSPSVPEEKISFSDMTGISFSLQITPCSVGKRNGVITITSDSGGPYLYSSDLGMSYKKIDEDGASLGVSAPKSCSFRLMEAAAPEKVTDIYTVYAGDVSENFTLGLTAVSSDENGEGGSITVKADKRDISGEIEVSIDGGGTWQDIIGSELTIDSLRPDMYRVTVREKERPENLSPTLNVPVLSSSGRLKAFIEAESILQNPELPTGCETVSLTMLLRYIGFDADKLTIADEYLPKGEYRKSDYNKVFVGDPRNKLAYGCTAAVICETAEKYLKDFDEDGKFRVRNMTGSSAEELYKFIDNNTPVIVWATIDMRDIIDDLVSWRDGKTGQIISWNGNEHCLLLTGYDREENLVYVNDPLKGAVSYDMALFEQRYEEMERNAVVITENQTLT